MRITQDALQKMRDDDEKIAILTCYDSSFATLLENAGVDILLVGDSLGNVLQGEESTLPVTLDDMIYHTRCVVRGSSKAFIMAETVEFLTRRGIPVCGHIGLTPQSVYQLGGYKVQGKTDYQAEQLMEDAVALEKAGAGMLLMEVVPATLAKQVTKTLSIPTIGIGAGIDCSAQVLVLYDMLGIYSGKKARFMKNFLAGVGSIHEAAENYVKAVKAGEFPGPEHAF